MSKNIKKNIFTIDTHAEYLELSKKTDMIININQCENGVNALHKALDNCNYEKAKWLIQEKINFNMTAFIHDNITADLQLLMIENGLDIHEKTILCKTCLHYANDERIVEALIEKGIDISEVDISGQTALFAAETTDVVKALIKAGAKVDRRNNEGRTALFGAEADVAKVLIENGADVNLKDSDGNTPIIFVPSKEAFYLLTENGAKVDVINEEGMNIFMLVHCQNMDAEYCLANGVNINHKERLGYNALHFLLEVENDEEEMLFAQYLIEKGADYQSDYDELPEILQKYIVMREEKKELNLSLNMNNNTKNIIRL